MFFNGRVDLFLEEKEPREIAKKNNNSSKSNNRQFKQTTAHAKMNIKILQLY